MTKDILLSEQTKKTVVITGSAGRIGRSLREGLLAHYDLRLLDIAEQDKAKKGETVISVDITDIEAMQTALSGAEAVVHLAAIPEEAPPEELVDPNLIGVYSVYEAARRSGVKRVIFASSNHVTGFYPRDVVTGPDDSMRPDTFYATTKAYGELLGRMYYEKWGLEVACLRIGAFRERPTSISQLSLWLSPRDCLQLVQRCLEAHDLGYLVVYGISANDRSWWSNESAKKIGYVPQDNAECFASVVEASGPEFPPGSRAAQFQGADFIELDSTRKIT